MKRALLMLVLLAGAIGITLAPDNAEAQRRYWRGYGRPYYSYSYGYRPYRSYSYGYRPYYYNSYRPYYYNSYRPYYYNAYRPYYGRGYYRPGIGVYGPGVGVWIR